MKKLIISFLICMSVLAAAACSGGGSNAGGNENGNGNNGQHTEVNGDNGNNGETPDENDDGLTSWGKPGVENGSENNENVGGDHL